MNVFHHGFGGSSTTHSRGQQGMSEIVIHHNTDEPLTTCYGVYTRETPEERQRRQREVAMAKAAAVTRFYGGTDIPQSLPVAQPVRDPPTAVVTRAPQQQPARRGTASEPGFLALAGTFRKSSSSLLSNEDNLSNGGSNHSIEAPQAMNNKDTSSPPPPLLKTEVTSLLLSPPNPPEFAAEITDVVTNPTTTTKPPTPRRISDSVTSTSTTRNQYKERPSFQANNYSIPTTTPVLPKKPTPNLYPSVAQGGTTTNSSSQGSNNEGGLLRGLAIEEQAQMLERFHQQQGSGRATTSPTMQVVDHRTLAVREQEKLWQQLSNSSINTATTTASSTASLSPPVQKLSPQEEQAKLWEQLCSQRSSSSSRRDPLEEQAQLLQAFQQKKAPTTTALTAVEEQERMLRSFQPPNKRTVNPIEEQAKRLREIQEAKERNILEMACQMSQSQTTALDRRDEEELSLQAIMDMSRREAENHTRAQQDLERTVLQEALQRSQQDFLSGSSSLQEHLRQHEHSVDLELRRSIAELACQSSERTLACSVTTGRRSVRNYCR